MVESPHAPWFIHGATGQSHARAELWEELRARPLPLRTICQPKDTRDALLELSRALVAGASLTLLDADVTGRELSAHGYGPDEVNRVTLGPGRADVTMEVLAGLASGGSAMRLGLYTSGTTGQPRKVEQSMATLARAVRVGQRHREAVWGLAFSPTHIAGVQVWLQATANGNPLVDLTSGAPAVLLDAIERHGVTHLSATPTYFRLLLGHARTIPSVRSITLGGEGSDSDLHRQLREMFPAARLRNIYASTEAGTLLESEGDAFSIPETLSRQLVVREGRLWVHRSLLGSFAVDSGGKWHDTGDALEILSEVPLRFRFASRRRDWINVGGFKLNPGEVEEALRSHPQVVDARVYGRPNPLVGQLVCAEVVAREPVPTEAALRAFATGCLQPFKIPRIIRFVTCLPMSRAGKALRS